MLKNSKTTLVRETKLDQINPRTQVSRTKEKPSETISQPIKLSKLDLMKLHLKVQTGENYTGPSASELYQEYIVSRGKIKPDLKRVVKKSAWSGKAPILLPLLPLIIIKVIFVAIITGVSDSLKIKEDKKSEEL